MINYRHKQGLTINDAFVVVFFVLFDSLRLINNLIVIKKTGINGAYYACKLRWQQLEIARNRRG